MQTESLVSKFEEYMRIDGELAALTDKRDELRREILSSGFGINRPGHRRRAPSAVKGNITSRQQKVYAALKGKPAMRLSDLARAVGNGTESTHSLLMGLIKRNLATRVGRGMYAVRN